MTDKGAYRPKIYDVNRSTQVAVKPNKQFLQDLNLLMASYRIDASEVIRGSVSAQAEYVRARITARLAGGGDADHTREGE